MSRGFTEKYRRTCYRHENDASAKSRNQGKRVILLITQAARAGSIDGL